MRHDIILIGPMGAGKSTVGGLLAQRLGMSQISMDDVREAYYREIGYNSDLAGRLHQEHGFEGLYRYWKPFEIYALERILADHHDCVIDLGAGHSVYEDAEQFRRAKAALAPYANVMLLLPSPELEQSLRILDARTGYTADMGFNINRHFLTHYSNQELATITVYTGGRTPEQTCGEILRITGTHGAAAAELDSPV
jgi:shikimate kinase